MASGERIPMILTLRAATLHYELKDSVDISGSGKIVEFFAPNFAAEDFSETRNSEKAVFIKFFRGLIYVSFPLYEMSGTELAKFADELLKSCKWTILFSFKVL